jgi:hypothetical protein
MVGQVVMRSFGHLSQVVMKMSRSIYENEPQLTWTMHLCLYVDPFQNVCLSNVEGAPFMCLTFISIYIDH